MGVQLCPVTHRTIGEAGLVKKERGLYSKTVQSGRLTGSCLRAHPLQNTQRQTLPPSARPVPGCAPSSFYHLKTLSFGNHSCPPHNHPSSSASFPTPVSPQAPSWGPHVGLAPPCRHHHHFPCWGLGLQVTTIAGHVGAPS